MWQIISAAVILPHCRLLAGEIARNRSSIPSLSCAFAKVFICPDDYVSPKAGSVPAFGEVANSSLATVQAFACDGRNLLIFYRVGMLVFLITALALGAFPVPLAAQPSAQNDLTSMEIYGTIGSYSVGLNYTVRNKTDLVTAHYLYASQLKDLRLTGQVRGEGIELKGEDGSIFHLHLVGNRSNGKEPLTFYNSVGLTGI